MIEQIVRLRRKGLSFRKIAKELNSTVGKVQYQWKKYMQTQSIQSTVIEIEDKEGENANAIPIITTNFWTSIDILTKKNGMEAWLLSEDTAFVFWRIPEGKWQLICSYYDLDRNDCSLAVKLSDITSIIYNGKNAHNSRLIPVNHNQETLIMEDLLPNRSFCFEIGVIDVYQSFLPIVQSNPLHTPRTSTEQAGLLKTELGKWGNGDVSVPNWIEHVSTYSYYELEANEDVKKK